MKKTSAPAKAYLDSIQAEKDKAKKDYQDRQIPQNKSAKAINPQFHLDALQKRRAKVVKSQETSEDQQSIADARELEEIDDTVKQLNSGMLWVESYMRGSVKVKGYWRKKNSFSTPKYGLGLPKTAGTGTTR
jgi:hypothetical protein